MTTDYRALSAELFAAVQLYTGQNPAAADMPSNKIVGRLMDAMAATAAALSQPEPVEPISDLTPADLSHLDDKEFASLCPQGYHATGGFEPVGPTDEDYIDCDITGSDRTLLDQFYAGAQREGGSADEVTLRGIHAVLDLLKSPEPTRVELAAMWQEQYGDCSATMTFAEFSDAARAVLARWGLPAITPIPVSERLPAAAAAVIRAVADQVVPANGSRRNNEIRAELLAIATELDGPDGEWRLKRAP